MHHKYLDNNSSLNARVLGEEAGFLYNCLLKNVYINIHLGREGAIDFVKFSDRGPLLGEGLLLRRIRYMYSHYNNNF